MQLFNTSSEQCKQECQRCCHTVNIPVIPCQNYVHWAKHIKVLKHTYNRFPASAANLTESQSASLSSSNCTLTSLTCTTITHMCCCCNMQWRSVPADYICTGLRRTGDSLSVISLFSACSFACTPMTKQLTTDSLSVVLPKNLYKSSETKLLII